MATLKEELEAEVKRIAETRWDVREGGAVPEPEQVVLANGGVKLDATVLYADMAESTGLVETVPASLAAEVYKAFLYCACKIIRANGGTITSFDGDRVMGVFVGDTKKTDAVKSALKLNYIVKKLVAPILKSYYETSQEWKRFVPLLDLRHAVGIDSSTILAARTGIRGSNDLVWVGRAANYAAKLATIRRPSYSTWITKAVYEKMKDEAKYTTEGGPSMWEEFSHKIGETSMTVYGSSYYWEV